MGARGGIYRARVTARRMPYRVTEVESTPARTPALVVVAIMVVLSLTVLDATVVYVAYPVIMGSLGATIDEVAWISTAYLLGAVIVLPLVGFLEARMGRKALFLTAATAFLLASAACAFAQDVGTLALARAVQGIGGGMLQPLGQACLFDAYPGERRSHAQVLLGWGLMIGPAIGPVIGGLLLTYASWPWIFLINVPLGSIAIVILWRGLPNATERPAAAPFAFVPFAAMALGFAALVNFLQRISDVGFDDPTIVLSLIAMFVCIPYFIISQIVAARPMMDLSLFRFASFRSGNIVAIFGSPAVTGVSFLATGFCEQVLGLNPLTTAWLQVPAVPATLIGLTAAPRLTRRFGAPRVMAGGLVGVAISALLFASLTARNPFIDVGYLRFLGGVTVGLLFVPLGLWTLRDVTQRAGAHAASTIALVRQMAAGVAIATVTGLIVHGTAAAHARAAEQIDAARPQVRSVLANAAVRRQYLAHIDNAARDAGYQDAFLFAAIASFCVVPLLFVRGRHEASKAG